MENTGSFTPDRIKIIINPMNTKYLITAGYNCSQPFDHGQILIDGKGFVGGETPVEDYGMFALSDKPFPQVIKDNIEKFFIALMYIKDGDLNGAFLNFPHDLVVATNQYDNELK